MKNKKGFTLIELVITLAILGIVLPMIFSPIIFSFENFKTQNKKTEIISEGRAAMAYVTREIRKSKVGAVITVTGNTMKIDSKRYEREGRNLLEIDEVTGEEKEIIHDGIDDLLISKDDEKITIKIVIKDSKNDNHTLSSDIYMRQGDE